MCGGDASHVLELRDVGDGFNLKLLGGRVDEETKYAYQKSNPRGPDILNKVLRGYSQSLKINARTVP